MMKKGRTIFSFMQFVLDDILFKILIIIASCSLRDLFLTMMVSKKFNEIAEDPCIYQLINITDFETCSNPEAFYMVRMQYFFRDNKEEAGLSGLRMRSLRAIK
ncbi:hypothetical protein DVH24_004905 [Malus domestica]|uniref:F-box domain-containing protein n=1 Tax=Malus domestica TaxID=3750 RepID=A0A498IHK7_MALDO|nr:hypothetical protein DVH24_004905 [Malus domestica]